MIAAGRKLYMHVARRIWHIKTGFRGVRRQALKADEATIAIEATSFLQDVWCCLSKNLGQVVILTYDKVSKIGAMPHSVATAVPRRSPSDSTGSFCACRPMTARSGMEMGWTNKTPRQAVGFSRPLQPSLPKARDSSASLERLTPCYRDHRIVLWVERRSFFEHLWRA